MQQVRQFVSASRRADSLNTMNALLASVVHQLGGLNSFSQLWVDAVKEATPQAKLRSIAALMKIGQLIEERQHADSQPKPLSRRRARERSPDEPLPSEMSDEEIMAEARELVEQWSR